MIKSKVICVLITRWDHRKGCYNFCF